MQLRAQVVWNSFVFLLLFNTCICDVNVTADTGCSGCWPKRPRRPTFTTDLNIGGLSAKIWKDQALPQEGCDPGYIWGLLASQMLYDANSMFGRGEVKDRYDIWPKVARSPGRRPYLIPEWTYAVRFSLVREASAKQIDRSTILAVSNLFSAMEKSRYLPDYSFSGNVSQSDTVLYQIRLHPTGLSAAESSKQRSIVRSDLFSLEFARHHILKYTTLNDRILFLGGSGSYIYYALNRPDDAPADKRKAYVIPMSGAKDWSDRHYLDRIEGSPQLQAFIREVLRPTAGSRSIPLPAGGRLIVIDHVCSGSTLGSFRRMLSVAGYTFPQLYIMNIEEQWESHIPSGWTKLKSIKIGSESELDILRHGGFGRVVAPYPWQYWDVPPESVRYPDRINRRQVIDFIRYKGKPPRGLATAGNGTADLTYNETQTSGWVVNSTNIASRQVARSDLPIDNSTPHPMNNQTVLISNNLTSDAVDTNDTYVNGPQCGDDGDWGGKTVTVPAWGCDDPDQACAGYFGGSRVTNATVDFSQDDDGTAPGDDGLVNGTLASASDTVSVVSATMISSVSVTGPYWSVATTLQVARYPLTDVPTS